MQQNVVWFVVLAYTVSIVFGLALADEHKTKKAKVLAFFLGWLMIPTAFFTMMTWALTVHEDWIMGSVPTEIEFVLFCMQMLAIMFAYGIVSTYLNRWISRTR